MAYETRSFPGNAAETTLVADINNSVLAGSIVDNTGWTFSGRFVIAIFKADGTNFEKILCSSFSGSAFTVVASGRGYDSTTAVSHSAGEIVRFIFDGVAAKESHDGARKTLGAVANKGDLLVGTGLQALAALPVGTDFLPLRAHSGATAGVDYGSIPQIASHDSPDTDVAPTSLHHTLGDGANQAAAGNHSHADDTAIPQASVQNLVADLTTINESIGANADAIDTINNLLSRYARWEGSSDKTITTGAGVYHVVDTFAEVAGVTSTTIAQSGGQFTPPAGVYLVSASARWQGNATNAVRSTKLMKNYLGSAAEVGQADLWPGTSTLGVSNIPFCIVVFNGTTDTICLVASQNIGSDLKVLADPTTNIQFVRIA